MRNSWWGAMGVLAAMGCRAAAEPSIPDVSPVVQPLPATSVGRSAEELELEAALEEDLDSALDTGETEAPAAPELPAAGGSGS